MCVVDSQGEILHERVFKHSATAISAFMDWLLSAGVPVEQVAVAIEVPRGAVVESLIERRLPVFAINPKQLDRFRDRYTLAGAKDDRRDAFVLADSLRTDRHRYRALSLDDPVIIQLRELSRAYDDLRAEANALANRLREQLYRYLPQLLTLSPSADQPWLWSILALATTPQALRQLPTHQLGALLRRHRIRRFTAIELAVLLRAPAPHVAPGTAEAASAHVQLLVPRLVLVRTQQRHCLRRMQQLLALLAQPGTPADSRQHADVEILRSLPGIGTIVAATILAEASQAIARRDYQALRTYGGVAPVTRQSGKRRLVGMRYACNDRLRNALYHWSRVSVQKDERSALHYRMLRVRGCTHGRALRGVQDRLLGTLVAMLDNDMLYDPARRAARPLGTAPQPTHENETAGVVVRAASPSLTTPGI